MAAAVALKAEAAAAAVSLPLGCGGGLWIYKASLHSVPPSSTILYLCSPHLPVSPPSLSPFFLFLSFSAALKHQHQQAEDNTRTHTHTHAHTQAAVMYSCAYCFIFCVWARTQKACLSYLGLLSLCQCVYKDAHVYASACVEETRSELVLI